jgi:hypothetical protein
MIKPLKGIQIGGSKYPGSETLVWRNKRKIKDWVEALEKKVDVKCSS